MSQLRTLKVSEYSDLYSLMLQEDFPNTPHSFYEAKQSFHECLCYGKFSKSNQILVAFIIGDLSHESAFVDIVCQKTMRGKWATKNTLLWLFKLIFKDINLKYIWVTPQRKESLKMAVKLGFKHVHGLSENELVTLVLSKNNVSNKYLNKGI